MATVFTLSMAVEVSAKPGNSFRSSSNLLRQLSASLPVSFPPPLLSTGNYPPHFIPSRLFPLLSAPHLLSRTPPPDRQLLLNLPTLLSPRLDSKTTLSLGTSMYVPFLLPHVSLFSMYTHHSPRPASTNASQLALHRPTHLPSPDQPLFPRHT